MAYDIHVNFFFFHLVNCFNYALFRIFNSHGFYFWFAALWLLSSIYDVIIWVFCLSIRYIFRSSSCFEFRISACIEMNWIHRLLLCVCLLFGSCIFCSGQFSKFQSQTSWAFWMKPVVVLNISFFSYRRSVKCGSGLSRYSNE